MLLLSAEILQIVKMAKSAESERVNNYGNGTEDAM